MCKKDNKGRQYIGHVAHNDKKQRSLLYTFDFLPAHSPNSLRAAALVVQIPLKTTAAAKPRKRLLSTINSGTVNSKGWSEALRERSRQHENLLKYFFIGGAASAIDVCLFLLLFNGVGTTALFAHSISVPTSVLFSFVTNARHNFHTNDYMILRLISFVTVCTVGYLVGYVVIVATVAIGYNANIGKIASLPIVFVLQYLLNSRITFRKISG